jgi:hypothetical protein
MITRGRADSAPRAYSPVPASPLAEAISPIRPSRSCCQDPVPTHIAKIINHALFSR